MISKLINFIIESFLFIGKLIIFFVVFGLFILLGLNFLNRSPDDNLQHSCKFETNITKLFSIDEVTSEWKIKKTPSTQLDYNGKVYEIAPTQKVINIANQITISHYENHLSVNNQVDKNQTNFFKVTYTNEKLCCVSIQKKELNISIHFNNSLLLSNINIHEVNGYEGVIVFFPNGTLRGSKFFINDQKTLSKNSYSNKKLVYDDGRAYFTLYSPSGEILMKWSQDNDFCKAKFFKDNQLVSVPKYFHLKEYNKILLVTKLQLRNASLELTTSNEL